MRGKKIGQSALEYMILLGTVVAIVLLGLKNYIPRIEETANIYYNRAAAGILGDPSRCGDGVCDCSWPENCKTCPTDCGGCVSSGCQPSF